MHRRTFFALIFIQVVFSTLEGSTLRVPSEYPTIQAGIDAAGDGDTILVAAGIYTGEGNVNIEVGSDHYLFSEAGPKATILDAEGLSDVCGIGSSEMAGFTLNNGHRGIYSGNSLIRDCIITGSILDGGIESSKSVTIADCIISGNYAQYYGGGIVCNGSWSSPVIVNCEISNNSAAWRGGAIYYSNEHSQKMEVIGCTIYGNTAGIEGGVAYVKGSYSYSYSSPVLVLNSCIVQENSEPYFDFSLGGSTTITYTDIQDGWTGIGNIDVDPLFIDPLNDDFRLKPDSPCIDTGDPELPPRYGGGHSRHDMGANEYLLWFDYGIGTLHTVRRVPADYPTIQAAIDASAPEDTILVAAGTYTGEGNGDITIPGRSLVLISESGPDSTIIDCEYETYVSGFVFEGHDIPETVKGFTVQHSARYGVVNNANLFIENCIFTECYFSAYGHTIATDSEEMTISECSISNNVAEGNGTAGIFYSADDYSYNLIVNTLFTSNDGPSIGCLTPQLDVINCTFADNTGDYCVWIREEGVDVQFDNCIFWNNTPGNFEIDNAPDPIVRYSDIMGGWEGEGNIDTDPLFRDPGSGDYHLSAFSPCIDAADGNVAPRLDLDGTLRLDDPLVPNTGLGPPWVDMGAYERAGIIHLLRRRAGE